MPGPLAHVGAAAMCPHGGQISIVPSNARVVVSGQTVATLGDVYPIVGCPFNLAGTLHPCVKVQGLAPAARVLVNGQPAILQISSGLCLSADQTPQGPPVIVTTQPRVVGT